MTGIYGEFRWENKHLTWSCMRQLHQAHTLPWLLVGDLNEIVYLHEKEGGNPRPPQYMQVFQDIVEECALHDLRYIGNQYTWRRGRIRERLDRGLVNYMWTSQFPHAALRWSLIIRITDLFWWTLTSMYSHQAARIHMSKDLKLDG